MTIASLRDYEPRLPANIDDVSDALSDAQAEAHDAAQQLEKCLSELHGCDACEAGSRLATAIACLREALSKAESAASPLVMWADRQSGDW